MNLQQHQMERRRSARMVILLAIATTFHSTVVRDSLVTNYLSLCIRNQRNTQATNTRQSLWASWNLLSADHAVRARKGQYLTDVMPAPVCPIGSCTVDHISVPSRHIHHEVWESEAKAGRISSREADYKRCQSPARYETNVTCIGSPT